MRVVPKTNVGVIVRIAPIAGNKYNQRDSMLSEGRPSCVHIRNTTVGGISKAARIQVSITPGPDQGSSARGKYPNAGHVVRETVTTATTIHPIRMLRLAKERSINL